MGLLDIFCVFDWISPAAQTLEELAGATTIEIVDTNGQTCAEVTRELQRAGIKTGTGMIVGDSFLINVDNPDRARRELHRRGMR
jgi:hypothetical protein